MLAVGREVERYIVEAHLGEGGIANVFRVRHRTLKTLHALKVLKVGGRALCDRLVQEGQLQASIRHPNILAVTDVIQVDDSPGLLMEYVPGGALDTWLDNHRPSAQQAEEIFRGILAGVAQAHKVGLVHRDLKPGNVLVEVTERGLVPKVADFGLAKILLDEGGGSSATRSGVGMGTPAYMSPEQLRNAKGVDQRTDIFALGCILYELLCGRSPFVADDVLEVFAAIGAGRYVPPEDVVPGLPVHLQRAIRGCLLTQRERRPADCAAVLTILDGGAPRALTGAAWAVGPTAQAGSPSMVPVPTGPAVTFMLRDASVIDASGSLVELDLDETSTALAALSPSLAQIPPTKVVRPFGLWAALLVVALLVGAGLGTVALGSLGLLWQQQRQPTVAPVATVSPTPVLDPASGVSLADPGLPLASSPATSGPSAALKPSAPPVAPVSDAGRPSGSARVPSSPGQPPNPAGPGASAEPTSVASASTQASADAAVPSSPQPVAPETREAAPPPTTGTVSASGDAESVTLVAADGSMHKPGALPVGTYSVRVTFPGGVGIGGTVTVVAGKTVALTCSAEMQRCGGWTKLK